MSRIVIVANGDCTQVVGRRWATWRYYWDGG